MRTEDVRAEPARLATTSCFEAAVKSAAGLASRKGRPTALAVIEMSGATTGETALGWLRDLRVSDRAAQLDDRRFALLLPETEARDAVIAALRIAEYMLEGQPDAAARVGVTLVCAADDSLGAPLIRAGTGITAELSGGPPGDAGNPLVDPRGAREAALRPLLP